MKGVLSTSAAWLLASIAGFAFLMLLLLLTNPEANDDDSLLVSVNNSNTVLIRPGESVVCTAEGNGYVCRRK
jgi:hypothetical protein